jgi:hypothetical protein
MNHSVKTFSLVAQSVLCVLCAGTLFAQGYDNPLAMQGLDHTTSYSAASRGAGGLTIGIQNDVALMFSNPASMQTLKEMQLSVGGVQQFSKATQVQQYAPLRYYPNFSLLLEGLTGLIPDPDSNHIGGTPADSVQRPYDNIGPNWSRTHKKAVPIQMFFGAPVRTDGMRFTFGFGVVEYANLAHYYQNNNVLSPSILSVRPSPFPLPSNVLTREASWFQYSRSREGSLRGIGGAFAVSLSDEFSVGVSGLAIEGQTDDYEQHTGRGRFLFYSNYFRLDSVYSHVVRSGTSDYNGAELTFSAMYSGQYISFGFSAKPPMTIKRSYSGQTMVDTIGVPTLSNETRTDEVALPWRGTVGLSIAVKQNLRFGFEYEVRSYASANYSDSRDSVFNPWLSGSVFHAGLEYVPRSWFVLRAGVRSQAEVFEPEGNPIAGEPVRYSVYSMGCGFMFGLARLNIAYEYGRMKYQDVWGSAISLNTDTRHTIIADIVFEIAR